MSIPAAADLQRAAQASEAAAKAAAAAGVTVRPLEGLDEIVAACELFAAVWGTDVETLMPVGILRALEHAGNYAAGAFDGDDLVAAGVGFLGDKHGERHLHSHIVGVQPQAQSRSVGFAVKQHQRAWAVERAIDEVQWTFDPLVRRNGWFNVAKLGASVADYFPDFYGAMNDGINAGEPSDRGLVVWTLSGTRAVEASERRLDAAEHESLVSSGGVVVLAEGPDGRPIAAPASAPVRLCWVPEDIVSMRAADPAHARAWRMAVRDVFQSTTRDGLSVVGMTRTGCYVFAPNAT